MIASASTDGKLRIRFLPIVVAVISFTMSFPFLSSTVKAFIFCPDRFLRKMNKEYLEHDYNTDVITFDNSETKKKIAGEIYISIDRINANAKTYSTTFRDELHRVMIHGVLHLIGYDDSTAALKARMRGKEDLYLAKR